jgi:hypothetical protein
VVDVSVIHPGASMYCEAAAKTDGGAAAREMQTRLPSIEGMLQAAPSPCLSQWRPSAVWSGP